MSDEAIILVAAAGVCGIPIMTAVLFIGTMRLLRYFGVKVK